MACGRSGILPAIFNKKNQLVESSSRRFLENGSMLLEDLIAFSNGRYDIPIRRFSISELSQATNGFCSDGIVIERSWYRLYKGSFEERLIFIKKYHDDDDYDNVGRMHQLGRSESIRDLVMMTVLSSHKNVFKVLGCCLDFEIPALVCEYTGSSSTKLSSFLYERNGTGMSVEEINGSKILTWKSRVKIANEIASLVLYMHTAFPTPVIHRDLKPENIIVDQCGAARVWDFALSISIPPGETQVEFESMVGTYEFMAPEYVKHGIVNEKSDVYGFGMILFGLLTGKRASELLNPLFRNFAESSDDSSSDESINKHPRDFGVMNYEFLYDFENMDQLNNVVDPTILRGGGGGIDEQGQQQQQQFRAFAALALRCVQRNREDRPEMIEVAKELRQMLKSVCPSS